MDKENKLVEGSKIKRGDLVIIKAILRYYINVFNKESNMDFYYNSLWVKLLQEAELYEKNDFYKG